MEKNRIELTGTIHKLFKLKTKAGAPMTKILQKVGKDTFWIISYGNVAAAIGRLNEGDELSIAGTAQMNNWKTEAGEWKNDFNAVAWIVEIDGQEVSYQKPDIGKPDQSHPNQAPPPDDRDPSQYEYSEGPF